MGNQTEFLKPQKIDNKKFAAFVMTYQRPVILLKTIKNLLSQTLSPALILVVDNSEDLETKIAIEKFAHPLLEYHQMEQNIGPAGAAVFGLKNLTHRGYQWIYWGDDDNPPRNELVFHKMFKKITYLQSKKAKIGLLAGKGGNINKFTGRLKSLSNEELLFEKVIAVDCVPGGHDLIVNSEVIRNGVTPSEKLFFGFEELDFSLRVQKKNFGVYVDAETWLQVRQESNNIGRKFRYKASSFGDPLVLTRLYYSTRNLLFIYFYHRWYIAFTFVLLKSIVRSFAGIVFGASYGRRNFLIIWEAIIHFFLGKFGKKK